MAGFIDTSIGKETDPKSARDRYSAQRPIRWDWRCAVVLGLPTFMRGLSPLGLELRSKTIKQ